MVKIGFDLLLLFIEKYNNDINTHISHLVVDRDIDKNHI